MHDLDLTVRAAGLNGIPLLGNGGSVDDPSTPDRWAGFLSALRVGLVRASCAACCCRLAQCAAAHFGPCWRCITHHSVQPRSICCCRENNVEQVTLDSLPGGPVAITVRGHSVFGEGGVPQYALVVNGDFRWAPASNVAL